MSGYYGGKKYHRYGNVVINTGRKPVQRKFRRTNLVPRTTRKTSRKSDDAHNRTKRSAYKSSELVKAQRFVEPLQPEMKSLDAVLSITSTSSAAQLIGQFLAVSTGTAADQRIGKNITLKKICIRGNISYFPNISYNGQPTYDMWLVLDTQTNGALPTVLDVFDNLFAWLAFPNIMNTSRFIILKHWSLSQNLQAIYAAAPAITALHWKIDEEIDLPNVKMTYSGTTGAITEIKSNNLLVIAGGFVYSPGGDSYELDATVRTYFTDP